MSEEDKNVIDLIRNYKQVYGEYPGVLAVPRKLYSKLKHKRVYFYEPIPDNFLYLFAYNGVSFAAPITVEITAE